MTPELDHLVLGCLSLEQARPKLEAALGVPAQDGGARGAVYLELIAPDPAQETPAAGTLPFGLHLEATRQRLMRGPRLLAWVARCTDLDAWAARSTAPVGAPRDMRRGDLRWRLTTPEGSFAQRMVLAK